MKNAREVPAVTSLPRSPRDEADHRVRRYVLTMSIRVVCFALMVLVQPYGWYTWVFGISAAVLPYIAVVFANAGSDSTDTTAESPVQELDAPRPAPIESDTTTPPVFTIHEGPKDA
ncbi:MULTISPECIES: DUF3099 domain-containing protein [unclassified Microbacterium]|uniref:DUF3099 domain-containing protein n=1 Tax=unclassified Microbacterium TaxID=2609290 RepID=UPI000CFB75A6|nr:MULTISPECIES: DUF3099 domain-containing protein [unclassified Microbacterium]PQZ60649.1 hypothetical protein CQ032_03865 [Microbacterium sp. MYb43]PQZ82075.1 hypothetical protein CQ031_01265 [Microbacterium sp. MYb40]PRB22337.1 hypothetical protein CQ040_06840 [Microbacterium sp. MYb54]PRB31097.1 hypothetical protein CQ037_03190 [Microbacterium sp. MYb50]PRB69707.1 hypothetical protein CQ021_02970 [Microbacterium sp. MYb24]